MKRYDLETSNQELIKEQTLGRQNRLTLRQLQIGKRPLVQKSVILGDISGSMSGVKLRELQKTLSAVWSPGIAGIVFGSQIYEITESDIGSLCVEGSTHMLAALEAAWGEYYSHIILITDGEPTDAQEDKIIRIAQEEHADVPIDTVGIGQHGSHNYNPDFLRELSRVTGGKFTDCGEPIMLTMIVQQLVLEYKPKGHLTEGTQKGGVIQL